MSAQVQQQVFSKAGVQRAFFTRKPVAVRAARLVTMAQLSQDELKKQVRGRARPMLCGSARLRPPPPPPRFQCSQTQGITLSNVLQAAWKAVDYVKSGMVVGLGTGSTAAFAVDRIGDLLGGWGALCGLVKRVRCGGGLRSCSSRRSPLLRPLPAHIRVGPAAKGRKLGCASAEPEAALCVC
jgi:hypothetical protein